MVGEDKKCRLCGEFSELCQSHYLPKCFYNAARHKGGVDEISAPVLANPTSGTVQFTNKQITKKLLCDSCEQLFHIHGEDRICSEIRKHDEFLLRDKMLHGVDSTDTQVNSDAVRVDAEAYAYFALSVIWRGSATEWTGGVGSIFDTLGKYENPIAEYLLRKGGFPKDIYIRVYVNTNDPLATGFGFPYKEELMVNGKPAFRYEFNAPGVFFSIFFNTRFQRRDRVKYSFFDVPVSFRKRDFQIWERYMGLLDPVIDMKPVGKLMLDSETRLRKNRK